MRRFPTLSGVHFLILLLGARQGAESLHRALQECLLASEYEMPELPGWGLLSLGPWLAGNLLKGRLDLCICPARLKDLSLQVFNPLPSHIFDVSAFGRISAMLA